MENCTPEIGFRFKSLNKLQAFTLEREVQGATYEMAPNKDCYVGLVPLNDLSTQEINDFYVRQMVQINDCDIFVSVESEYNSNIVDIPSVVNRMLKYIDCSLTYSFTVK
mgnify:CR=1 FL=1